MKNAIILLLALPYLFISCKKDENKRIPDATYNPVMDPANFTNSTVIDNPYFPLIAGKTYVFEAQTSDGLEHIEVSRTGQTKVILGITCVVVHDTVTLDGVVLEDTYDWYAQDNEGNVWYMGELANNYENGIFKDTHGSWEAGVDGAKPGIVMPANPKKGDAFRQEYYFNEAEDEAEIIETGVQVTTPYDSFDNCLKTKETTELEPDVLEHKFYAPGIGIVKTVHPNDGEEEVLIDIRG